eukprot:994992-Prymnesium_polylepis.1
MMRHKAVPADATLRAAARHGGPAVPPTYEPRPKLSLVLHPPPHPAGREGGWRAGFIHPVMLRRLVPSLPLSLSARDPYWPVRRVWRWPPAPR